ncbi:hypothetical protein FCK90_02945 [Kocuria coralli]|uniref:Uncharacterized protein n=1 Tax=Kocuria coralli TaxID=1461025 RepID=A0A5J5L0L0_9MICC|nr:hypothetical protein [Kocuria coralli]KAA9395373.1 hypothetical protein FCK90_02945 [Kocuria coralli]
MTPRALRLTRGWAASFVATGAAVLAHVAAGGAWPPPMIFALCVALSAPVCMLLAGLRIPLAGLTLAVVVSQGLFHALLSLTGAYVTAADRTGHAGHLGGGPAGGGADLVLVPAGGAAAAHAGHSHVASAADAAVGAVSGGHALAMGASGMLIMHVMAAVLAIFVLRYGEAGLFKAMAALLVRAVRLAVAVAMPWVSVRPWHPGFLAPLPARVVGWARSSMRYRGPPRALRLT